MNTSMAKMNVNPRSKFIQIFMYRIQHYNPSKYWRYRAIVVDPDNKTPKIIKLWYLFYIKRCDAFNNASFGTDLNQGAVFKTAPELPHGLNGIIVHLRARVGSNVVIWQQANIVSSGGGTPVIGDNAKIGAGAKIIGGITLGNNVIVGANAVVTHDIPDNCVVAGVPARVIEQLNIKNEDG
jgi:serine acetyltransferase